MVESDRAGEYSARAQAQARARERRPRPRQAWIHLQPSQGCGIRAAVGGGLVADTFLLTITSHTGTHIPTS